MEVLARIPELPAVAAAGPVPGAAPAPPVAPAAGDAGSPDEPRADGGPVRRRRWLLVPTPSIVLLAAAAAAFWAAAWRSEHLRLEAQRARPERLAAQLPATPLATESRRP